ncbi:hypothetical protein FHS94_001584 [Sphingomonas aerophila]|uniref:Uncharacterized protein n=1 Tax=Sphingomonas aerophila TaxID=1344948 RepID=A0A7W9BD09_9SPHN|nr:hypothetical protein [Sphingomonas aerophila]
MSYNARNPELEDSRTGHAWISVSAWDARPPGKGRTLISHYVRCFRVRLQLACAAGQRECSRQRDDSPCGHELDDHARPSPGGSLSDRSSREVNHLDLRRKGRGRINYNYETYRTVVSAEPALWLAAAVLSPSRARAKTLRRLGFIRAPAAPSESKANGTPQIKATSEYNTAIRTPLLSRRLLPEVRRAGAAGTIIRCAGQHYFFIHATNCFVTGRTVTKAGVEPDHFLVRRTGSAVLCGPTRLFRDCALNRRQATKAVIAGRFRRGGSGTAAPQQAQRGSAHYALRCGEQGRSPAGWRKRKR